MAASADREHTQVVRHVSIALLKRSFTSIRDAFRFFVAGRIEHSAALSDLNLERFAISPEQLARGVNALLLKLRPCPRPSERPRGGSWSQDVDDVLVQVELRHGKELSLRGFVALLAWDAAEAKEALALTVTARRELDRAISEDIRGRRLRQRWRRLVAHLRVRRGVNRWRHLTLAFYSNAWIAWWRKRRRKHALMARIAEPLARRAARALRCAFEALLVSNPQGDARARRGAALESEQERRARLFLASHAFVATPAQAFLAGLSAPMELVCGRPDDPPVPSNSLLAYVKARPLADAGPAGPACLAAAPARRPAAVERVLGRARGGHAVPPPLAAALVGRPGDAGRAASSDGAPAQRHDGGGEAAAGATGAGVGAVDAGEGAGCAGGRAQREAAQAAQAARSSSESWGAPQRGAAVRAEEGTSAQDAGGVGGGSGGEAGTHFRSSGEMSALQARAGARGDGPPREGAAAAEEKGLEDEEGAPWERRAIGAGRAPGDAPGTFRYVTAEVGSGANSGRFAELRRLHVPGAPEHFLEVRPGVLHFQPFTELGAKHTLSVTIANVSGRLRRIRILPPQTRFFAVFRQFANQGRVAAGMAVTAKVVFTPHERRSYYDCLRIQCEDAEREYLLPIHAFPARRALIEAPFAPLPARPPLGAAQRALRAEQFALTAVDRLRSALRAAVRDGDPEDGAVLLAQRQLRELEKEVFLGATVTGLDPASVEPDAACSVPGAGGTAAGPPAPAARTNEGFSTRPWERHIKGIPPPRGVTKTVGVDLYVACNQRRLSSASRTAAVS